MQEKQGNEHEQNTELFDHKLILIYSFILEAKDAQCQIPSRKFHIPSLPFTCIGKNLVIVPPIRITVLPSRLPGKNEDIRIVGARTNTALPIATILHVDVIATMVDVIGYKGN
jgi:hypothetical protein